MDHSDTLLREGERCVEEMWISHGRSSIKASPVCCHSSIHELVADAVDAADELGPCGIIFHFFPNVGDMAVHGSVGDGQVVDTPYEVQEFIPGDDLSLPRHHELE